MKKGWIAVLAAMASLPVALAVDLSVNGVWQIVLSFGNLGFLGLSDGSVVAAFTRILIWILLFTIFFGVMTTMGAGGAVAAGGRAAGAFGFLNRGQAGIIAAVVATIGTVYMPTQVLLATGAGWATVISLVLVGLPIFGVWWALLSWPGAGRETRATLFLKFLMCLLLFWVLSAMRFHLARMI